MSRFDDRALVKRCVGAFREPAAFPSESRGPAVVDAYLCRNIGDNLMVLELCDIRRDRTFVAPDLKSGSGRTLRPNSQPCRIPARRLA